MTESPSTSVLSTGGTRYPKKVYRLEYPYSKGWLIFWAFIFFPIAIVLILTGGTFTDGSTRYAVRYAGERFWLCFWTFFFFPISLFLLFANGVQLEVTEGVSSI